MNVVANGALHSMRVYDLKSGHYFISIWNLWLGMSGMGIWPGEICPRWWIQRQVCGSSIQEDVEQDLGQLSANVPYIFWHSWQDSNLCGETPLFGEMAGDDVKKD